MKHAFFAVCLCAAILQAGERSRPAPRPISVYINWAAYDELSDNVELTEELALRQLNEVLRLRRLGVRIDYYVNDCFWFSKEGGYRSFRKPHWPNGPDRWLEACRRNGLKPGLWVATNTLRGLTPLPEWKDSLNRSGDALCLFEGGYLRHFIGSLQYWYDRGVRLYKFDFSNFEAATPAAEKKYTREEIVRRNMDAFRNALFEFREKNPEVVLIAYNGFGSEQRGTFAPFRKSVDLSWLDVFDSIYCGDPRPADVPAINFWRSKDIYSDHMVRRFEQDNFPLERIDNSAFMIGTTGTCYNRRTSAWKGMLILSLARGGWVNTYYGNLELLTEDDARWFAKAQSMFMRLQELGRTRTFGAVPGEGKPYGYVSAGETGEIYTVVNPSQSILKVDLPAKGEGRVLFRDAGFVPVLSGGAITLGPEQMAVVGFGRYADASFDLGVQEDVVIPTRIRPLAAQFKQTARGELTGTVTVPAGEDLRIIMQQFGKDGYPLRTTGGSPPDGTSLGKLLRITATQDGKELPIEIQYDKAIWSGLSWAAGEIKARDLDPGKPVTIRFTTEEKQVHRMTAQTYGVVY
ncbi:MAG TPA: hypothetical protein PLA43_07830 [Bryobacteraceae bacterium]|nr:hypothetical protein [Bryobacteraceae bacterium]HOQ44640.1 hypothetical protein [Bryobacteraceae bacterium]HPU71850.1 hypothetical protein [Bryobacteraceae bacterium]